MARRKPIRRVRTQAYTRRPRRKRRRRHVDVIPVDQNVGTAGPGITGGQNDVARKLVLHVDVELLDPALLEVGILRQNGPGEIGGIRRRSENREIPTTC